MANNSVVEFVASNSKEHLPSIFYGTAWKEDNTQALTELAIAHGFRAIDTANQRRHYFEEGVGKGIQSAIARGLVTRQNLFLQTKFTFRSGQDHRLPYDPHAPIGTQVLQSMEVSLSHLGVNKVDSYVLHGPSQRHGIKAADWDAWRAMEHLAKTEVTRHLGISNITFEQLQTLWEQADIKPAFVQNRCFAIQGWDRQIRQFCTANGILYQGFSLLTANREVLASQPIRRLAQKYERTVPQIIFRFAHQVGMIILTGTTNSLHMQDDLKIFDFELTDAEVLAIESICG